MVGCYNRVQFPSQTPSETTVEHTKIYLLWGLIGEENYELYEDCPTGNIYEINAYTSFFQGVLTGVTLGIYSPRTVEVICGRTLGEGERRQPTEETRRSQRQERRDERRRERSQQSESRPMQEDRSMPTEERPKPFDIN